MDIKQRVSDPGYQKVLGDMIDEFFDVTKDTELRKVFHAEAPSDMVEVMIRYFGDEQDIQRSLMTMFVLGVYLAHKNDAILPTSIQ
jgi:hypothetical protein